MNTIEKDNLKHSEKYKSEPPHPSYISGFIDGDSCYYVRKIYDGYQSGICITQCRTNVLQIIRYHFGGSITTSKNRNNKIEDVMNDGYYDKYNKRNQFNLLIRSNEYPVILDYLKNYTILKNEQFENLYQFSKLCNLVDKTEEKEEIYKKCTDLNENKIFNNEDTILKRLNIEYISGLLDAEGCFYIDKKCKSYYITIAQKSHPVILYEIQKFLGFGKIYKNQYELTISSKENCLTFIEYTKKHLIVKYNQACAFETFLRSDDIKVKEEMYKICNEEKHKIEVFHELNQNDDGKEGYFYTMKMRELKEKMCKEIHRKEVYKLKSVKMMGEGNHNFGKQKSVETRKKMSNSIRDSKNSVSDEIILAVRKMIQEGKKNTEIQEIMNLPRHTVTRIKNGIIVCRNEEIVEKKSTTQEERNIKKRKIQLNEILLVIEKTTEGKKPNIILHEVYEKNNQITIDIVKNIRRQVMEKKVPFYECEVSTEMYEKYKKIIEESNCR
jgi:hypothetical protein